MRPDPSPNSRACGSKSLARIQKHWTKAADSVIRPPIYQPAYLHS